MLKIKVVIKIVCSAILIKTTTIIHSLILENTIP